MSYTSTPDPYIDPATGVLANLLGIASAKELENAEADIPPRLSEREVINLDGHIPTVFGGY